MGQLFLKLKMVLSKFLLKIPTVKHTACMIRGKKQQNVVLATTLAYDKYRINAFKHYSYSTDLHPVQTSTSIKSLPYQVIKYDTLINM